MNFSTPAPAFPASESIAYQRDFSVLCFFADYDHQHSTK